MTPGQADPLAQLRDIHLPEAVGYWPPAPGWWLLAGLLLLAMGIAIYAWRKRQQARRYRKLALQQLAQLSVNEQPANRYLVALNTLLKQTLLAAPGTHKAAGLSGEQWLAFLDRTGKTDQFTHGPGQYLRDAPYRPASQQSIDSNSLQQLHRLAEHWIKTHQLPEVSALC